MSRGLSTTHEGKPAFLLTGWKAPSRQAAPQASQMRARQSPGEGAPMPAPARQQGIASLEEGRDGRRPGPCHHGPGPACGVEEPRCQRCATSLSVRHAPSGLRSLQRRAPREISWLSRPCTVWQCQCYGRAEGAPLSLRVFPAHRINTYAPRRLGATLGVVGGWRHLSITPGEDTPPRPWRLVAHRLLHERAHQRPSRPPQTTTVPEPTHASTAFAYRAVPRCLR